MRLARTSLFDGIVVCHPGPFTNTELKAIKTPTSWVCAEGASLFTSTRGQLMLIQPNTSPSEDVFFSDSAKARAEAEFAGRKGTARFVEYEFKVYDGTTHGFACRPNLAYPEIEKAYRGALEQSAFWFERTLAT